MNVKMKHFGKPAKHFGIISLKRECILSGGIGSSGLLERFTTDYDLPNDRNYSESCASIGLAMFGKRMAEITRDAAYVEYRRKALYNTVLAGIAMMVKLLLCKSSGSMAGELHGKNFYGTCKTGKTEMV